MDARAFDPTLDLGKLRQLGRIFLILSLVVFITILVDQISLRLKRSPRIEGNETLSLTPSSQEAKATGPLALYQEIIVKRNLFNVETGSEGKPTPKVSIDELTKDLRLKGIVIISGPEAILEDSRTQGTVFLKEGSTLSAGGGGPASGGQDLTLKEIRQESVILSYGDQEKELRMEGGQIS